MFRLGSMFTRIKLNDDGGNLYKRWGICFNLILRNESYLFISLLLFNYLKLMQKDTCISTGIAWLSSVRNESCHVKLCLTNETHIFNYKLHFKKTANKM
jgi:hypothetical protein